MQVTFQSGNHALIMIISALVALLLHCRPVFAGTNYTVPPCVVDAGGRAALESPIQLAVGPNALELARNVTYLPGIKKYPSKLDLLANHSFENVVNSVTVL